MNPLQTLIEELIDLVIMKRGMANDMEVMQKMGELIEKFSLQYKYTAIDRITKELRRMDGRHIKSKVDECDESIINDYLHFDQVCRYCGSENISAKLERFMKEEIFKVFVECKDCKKYYKIGEGCNS